MKDLALQVLCRLAESAYPSLLFGKVGVTYRYEWKVSRVDRSG